MTEQAIENVLLEEGEVKITDARAILGGKTYTNSDHCVGKYGDKAAK